MFPCTPMYTLLGGKLKIQGWDFFPSAFSKNYSCGLSSSVPSHSPDLRRGSCPRRRWFFLSRCWSGTSEPCSFADDFIDNFYWVSYPGFILVICMSHLGLRARGKSHTWHFQSTFHPGSLYGLCVRLYWGPIEVMENISMPSAGFVFLPVGPAITGYQNK